MPINAIDEIGERQDVVRLRLGGETISIYGQYQVALSVFAQPAAFSMQLGWSRTAKELAAKFPPHTEFTLHIGDSKIATGWTDACDLRTGSGGTTVEIRGRDSLAPLHDAYV